MNYEVNVVKLGQCDVPGPEIYWMSHWDTWETLYFYMAVIRGGGTTAIVNTGPPRELGPLNEVWRDFAGPRCQMIRAEQERPEAALATLGLKSLADLTHERTYRWWGVGLLVVGLVACDVTALVKISQYFYTPSQYGPQSTIVAPADASAIRLGC